MPRWVTALLRVPLVAKLAGANALLLLITAMSLAAFGGLTTLPAPAILLVATLALAAGLAVNVLLVTLALRPLHDLEETAQRIWYDGDLSARVPASILADAELSRLRSALNLLLDGLQSDRQRMRELAAEVIRAGDVERAHIARDLHDGAAQTLAALAYQVSALESANSDPALADRVATAKQLALDVLEEVRTLSHTVYPRVLDDLGLVAALRHLARQSDDRSSADIVVDASAGIGDVPAPAAAVLYRVAQEAVGNALRHAAPTTVTLTLRANNGRVRLEVVDDGRGFDVGEAERRRSGMGLFTMRERVKLLDGDFELTSRPDRGTRVVADVPVETMKYNSNGNQR